jgi:hypothetical protein
VKIHADKIEAGPAHALTVRDVKSILRAVPPPWLEEVAEARLSNSLEHYRYAFFSRYDGCLTIYSRRATTKQAVMAVLTALAAAPLGIKLRFGGYPTDADRRRILRVIEPMADEIMAKITPPLKRGWWGHPVPRTRSTDFPKKD